MTASASTTRPSARCVQPAGGRRSRGGTTGRRRRARTASTAAPPARAVPRRAGRRGPAGAAPARRRPRRVPAVAGWRWPPARSARPRRAAAPPAAGSAPPGAPRPPRRRRGPRRSPRRCCRPRRRARADRGTARPRYRDECSTSPGNDPRPGQPGSFGRAQEPVASTTASASTRRSSSSPSVPAARVHTLHRCPGTASSPTTRVDQRTSRPLAPGIAGEVVHDVVPPRVRPCPAREAHAGKVAGPGDGVEPQAS